MEALQTILQREVLRTIAYFDVFSYPLTANQIHEFLIGQRVAFFQLEEAVADMVARGIIRTGQEYYYSSQRTDEIVKQRQEDERRAAKMLRKARWISFFLKQVPFVRAIFITGSLSKNVATNQSDIDYMIVTAPNRLWICKMILTAFRRIFLLNSKKYFCLNLMVTEQGIHFPDKNYFNAIEIATTQLIWNESMYHRYFSENEWIRNYLPNWRPRQNGRYALPDARSTLQIIIEFCMNVGNLNSLNANLMTFAQRFWRKKHGDLNESTFNAIIQCKPDISSVWSNNHGAHILAGYHRRLTEYGIEDRS
jgi:hypothetical protein